MRIISVKDNKNNRWMRNAKTKKGEGSYRERVRDMWFCWAFKLGFFQLICKASLIFKSNLELVLSIILKERESHGSKHVAVECRCLKMRLVIFFDIFLDPSFEMTTRFGNIARATASTSKDIY